MTPDSPSRFILSLDCEGKWGVADSLTPAKHRSLSDEKLREAYVGVVSLLDEFQIPATFAFVGLFAQSRSAFQRLVPELERLRERAEDYLGPALDDTIAGSRQGWHGDWAVDLVTNAKMQHEIGLHGVTHVPWIRCDRSFFEEELSLLPEISGAVARSRTFVFPRNEVAHVDLLSSAGFAGYRTGRARRSRAHSLLAEFDLRSQAERDPLPAGEGPVAIPAGYFVNWRSGARRLVPMWVTQSRFDHLLDSSTRGGIVHAWLHPENIASAPETLALLRLIIRSVAERRDAGKCIVLTQLDYVHSLTSTTVVQ